jgi:hypothetical protein
MVGRLFWDFVGKEIALPIMRELSKRRVCGMAQEGGV